MKSPSLLCSLGFLALFLTSCAYYDEKSSPDPASLAGQAISWQQVSTLVFEPRCAICHSVGGAGINVSDYNAVKAKISDINSRVLQRKSMPPGSPLTPYEATLLNLWINQGEPLGAVGNGS